MTVLIIYLIGVILSFVYLKFGLEEPYEMAIFTSVFFPSFLVLGILILIVTLIASLVLWVVETVKYAVRSIKNDK